MSTLTMNKKGDEMVSYILATAFFISLSVMIIIWAKGHTEDAASGTIKYMEGREECKMVFIDANTDCKNFEAENKGTLTIKKFVVRINTTAGMESNPDTVSLKPQDILPITLSSSNPISGVELLPLIEISNGQLASCTTKRLVIQCA